MRSGLRLCPLLFLLVPLRHRGALALPGRPVIVTATPTTAPAPDRARHQGRRRGAMSGWTSRSSSLGSTPRRAPRSCSGHQSAGGLDHAGRRPRQLLHLPSRRSRPLACGDGHGCHRAGLLPRALVDPVRRPPGRLTRPATASSHQDRTCGAGWTPDDPPRRQLHLGDEPGAPSAANGARSHTDELRGQFDGPGTSLRGENGWDYTVTRRPRQSEAVPDSICITTNGYQVNAYRVQ